MRRCDCNLPLKARVFDAKLVASALVLVSLRIYTKNTPLKAKCVLVKIPYFNAWIYVYCVYIYTIYTIYTIYSLTFTQTLTIYTLYTFDYTLSIIVTIASLCVYPLCLTIWLCGGECFQSKYLHNARNIPELSQLTLWVHSRWHKEIARIYRWSGIPILRAHIC
jgi:hypothetical protein